MNNHSCQFRRSQEIQNAIWFCKVEGTFCKEDEFAGKCRAKSKSYEDTRVKKNCDLKFYTKIGIRYIKKYWENVKD